MKRRVAAIVLPVAVAAFFGGVAAAQVATLPRGVGAVQIGMRDFATFTDKFAQDGARVSLAEPFNHDFKGKDLLRGANGDLLKKLASALHDYDGGDQGAGSLINELDLGSLHGDVRADVKAQYLGTAYGITDHVSLFGALPWIDADTRASLSFNGNNNALAIKDKLGDLAFDELKSGLTRAGALGVADIKGEIEGKNYKSIDHWHRTGVGDATIGARGGWNRRLNRNLSYGSGIDARVIAPTGRTKDPDALTDVPFGKGYFGVALGLSERATVARHGLIGADVSYAKNFDHGATRRVPVNGEALVDPARKASVELNPGDDNDWSALLGSTADGVTGMAKYGTKRHFGDRYSGALPGDYAALGVGTSTVERYGELIISYDTINAYSHRRFPVPFMTNLVLHRSLSGVDANDFKYVELSLTSFFK